MNDLLTYGEIKKEPFLGVTVLRGAIEAEAGVRGLQVLEVVRGSAADNAGIQTGDVILDADGNPLEESLDLLRCRRRHHLGDTMTVTLWRQGSILEATLLLKDAVD